MLNRDEYDVALARIDELMANDPEVGTPEGTELTALVDQVIEYEMHHFPMLGFSSSEMQRRSEPQ
jgi:antitoxin component HigA of HigAB toxin-antitoxin module